MSRKLLWSLAFRQVWSNANSPVVRIVSLLSVAGIAIGVAALVILQAFMGGFTSAIAQGLSAVNPPLYVYAPGGEAMNDFDLGIVQEIADSIPGITGVTGILEKSAVVSGGQGTVSGAVVRGVGGGSDKVIIGDELARILDSEVGGEIRIASSAGLEISGAGRVLVDTIAAFTVDSIADFGIAEYNKSLVIIPLAWARSVFRAGSDLTAAGASLAPGYDPVAAAELLDSVLYEEFVQGGWPVYMSCIPFLSFHGNLFRALGLERTAMTIVLALITVVALLNLSSALAMIAMEHRRDTGVLRAIGFPDSGVFRVSVLRGLILGGTGAVSGLLVSIASVFLVNRLFPIKLDGSVYWVDTLPGVFPAASAALVTMVTVAVCVMVSMFPAASSLSFSPSEALRYE